MTEIREWQPIETAPSNTSVIVKVGEHMAFAARLIPHGSMNSDEQACDQWQAEHEGEHPECWDDGCCWESNASECMSLQPTHWQPLPDPPISTNTRG